MSGPSDPCRSCEGEGSACPVRGLGEGEVMNLVVWLPAMFVLGVVSMGLCYVFVTACEKI